MQIRLEKNRMIFVLNHRDPNAAKLKADSRPFVSSLAKNHGAFWVGERLQMSCFILFYVVKFCNAFRNPSSVTMPVNLHDQSTFFLGVKNPTKKLGKQNVTAKDSKGDRQRWAATPTWRCTAVSYGTAGSSCVGGVRRGQAKHERNGGNQLCWKN